jgi:multidrug efflux pump subunit AcrA (membrane-fusion protein)
VGSGPADETVIVSQWFVEAGQQITRGDVVAALEATKLSIMDVLTAAQNIEKEVGKRYSALADQATDRDTKATFRKLAQEEASIRENPVKQTTALLKKVFGAK